MKKQVLQYCIIAALFFSAAAFGQNAPKKETADGHKAPTVLAPDETGEFLRLSKKGDAEWDSPHEFTRDPNGQYYDFGYSDTEVQRYWGGLFVNEKTFTATSSLAPYGNISYSAQNLGYDTIFYHQTYKMDNRRVAWCEGVKGYGIGESVTMSITTQTGMTEKDRVYKFGQLMIVNGYAKDQTTWKNNTRVKTLRLYVSGKHWCDLHLADIIKPQIFNFPPDLEIYPARHGIEIPANGKFEDCVAGMPVYQTDLKFEIMEVYPGDKYDDTCITGIAADTFGAVVYY